MDQSNLFVHPFSYETLEKADTEPSLLFRPFGNDLDLLDHSDSLDAADPYGLTKEVQLEGTDNVEEERHTHSEEESVEEKIDDTLPFHHPGGDFPPPPASWEEFYSSSASTDGYPTLLLSERSDSLLFDSIVQHRIEPGGIMVPSLRVLSCLFNLAMGRESLMFAFSETRLAFKPSSPYTSKVRIPGCTTKSLQGLVEFCLQCGSRLMRLKYTAKTIHKLSQSPVLIAFADCLNLVVHSIERAYTTNHHQLLVENNHVLQLQHSLRPAAKIVSLLTHLLGCGDISIPVKLNRLPKPWSLLNALYARSLVFESSDTGLFQLTRLLLERASEPWLRSLEDIIGLGRQETFWRPADYIAEAIDSFVQVDSEERGQLLKLDFDKIPKFLDRNLAYMALQTLNCFIILSRHGGTRINETLYALHKVELEWCFDSSCLAQLSSELKSYESRLNREIFKDSSEDNVGKKATGKNSSITDSNDSSLSPDIYSDNTPSAIQQRFDMILEDIENMHIEQDSNGKRDPLEDICEGLLLSNSGKDPVSQSTNLPMVMSGTASFSETIKLQSQLSNRLVLDLFNQDNELNLKAHTNLLRQIYLLGSGKLVRDMEDMLFDDPTGLQMDVRNNWPPSASELNQTLSNVVEEAVKTLPQLTDKVRQMGYLNFGLAPKSSTTTAQDLYSMDSLKLCYSVPSPLSLIITPKVCRLYDKVFSRLLRLLYTMHHLKTKDMIKRSEYAAARHFMWVVSNHFISNVIEYHWQQHLDYDKFMTLDDLIETHHNLISTISRDMLIDSNQLEKIMEKILQLNTPYEHEIVMFLQHLEKQKLQVMINYNGYFK